MADSADRGRRRKKRLIIPPTKPGGRERESEQENPQPGKTLVILAKPHHDDQLHSESVSKPNEGTGKSPARTPEIKAPTVLLKTRDGNEKDGSSSSPGNVASHSAAAASHSSRDVCSGTAGSSVASSVGQQPVYQIQQKSGHVTGDDQKLSLLPEMLTPVKLIDGENLQWCDNAMEFLVDQTNFYVVGILGLQGSGKSTVMSLLAGQLGEIGGRQLFKPETRELREKGEHCTSGVDIYVTSERMILLDTQPLLSASVMDHMIQFEKKIPCGTDYRATEIALQIQSLQIAAFLLTVCHTVILVQDWFTDPNLLRFIQSAEMLKPATPTNPHDLSASIEDTTDYYPHLVFLQNKCRQGDFSPSTVCEMEELLSNVFQNSKLKSTGSVLMEFIPIRCESLHMDVANLFLLPERETEETGVLPSYRGHPGFNSLGKSLTQQIMSVPRSSLTHTALSEKNWFHYAARMWEAVKKSSLFLEYGRLLP